MNKQKVLEKALLKAHKNGWKPLKADWRNVEVHQWENNGMIEIAMLYGQKGLDISWVRELEGIIYNHDFARALWGESQYMPGEIIETDSLFPFIAHVDWQYHLQNMVIADDPIKYLADNI